MTKKLQKGQCREGHGQSVSLIELSSYKIRELECMSVRLRYKEFAYTAFQKTKNFIP
jgi:hypothetical protein